MKEAANRRGLPFVRRKRLALNAYAFQIGRKIVEPGEGRLGGKFLAGLYGDRAIRPFNSGQVNAYPHTARAILETSKSALVHDSMIAGTQAVSNNGSVNSDTLAPVNLHKGSAQPPLNGESVPHIQQDPPGIAAADLVERVVDTVE